MSTWDPWALGPFFWGSLGLWALHMGFYHPYDPIAFGPPATVPPPKGAFFFVALAESCAPEWYKVHTRNIKNRSTMFKSGAKIGFWRVWAAILDPFAPP